MKPFRTGAEVRCPGIMTIPIDDDHKFTVADYREKLYNQVPGACRACAGPRVLRGLFARHPWGRRVRLLSGRTRGAPVAA
eukprot:3240902-Prymnesium_polylepis.1